MLPTQYQLSDDGESTTILLPIEYRSHPALANEQATTAYDLLIAMNKATTGKRVGRFDYLIVFNPETL